VLTMNRILTATAAITFALTLGACDKNTSMSRSDAPPSTTANPGMSTPPNSPSSDMASDTATTAKVKAALMATDSISSTKITVETKAGRVMLKGNLPDRAMIDRVLAAVQSVPGVRAVDNQLSVGSG
jgi:hyperosmotically inducible periplasmic protein